MEKAYESDPVVILAAAARRSAPSKGAFATVTAPQLGSVAIKAALADSGVAASQDRRSHPGLRPVGRNRPGNRRVKQPWAAGYPPAIPTTHGQQDVRICDACGHVGQRSDSRRLCQCCRGRWNRVHDQCALPSTKARAGYPHGTSRSAGPYVLCGLQSPWDGQLMGCFAEATSEKYEFTRKAQDDFAAESVRRALAAVTGGSFAAEIAPVTTKNPQGRSRRRQGRNAVYSRYRQDSHAQAGVQEGRDGDRRQFLRGFPTVQRHWY